MIWYSTDGVISSLIFSSMSMVVLVEPVAERDVLLLEHLQVLDVLDRDPHGRGDLLAAGLPAELGLELGGLPLHLEDLVGQLLGDVGRCARTGSGRG